MSRIYDGILLRNPALFEQPLDPVGWRTMMREMARYTNNGFTGAYNLDCDPIRFEFTGSGVPPAVMAIPGGSTVVALLFSGLLVNEVFFRMAIPEWFRNPRFNLVFRVHWGPSTAVGIPAMRQVVWNVDYETSDPGTALAGPATTVTIPGVGFADAGGVIDAHIVTPLTAIAGSALATATAAAGEASMLLGRLWRDPAAAGDTYAAASWLWRLEARWVEV